MPDTTLAHFNRARFELAKATKIDEIKVVRDKAEALRAYVKQQGESLEMQNNCAEIKIRAERRAGEILKEIPRRKASAGRPQKAFPQGTLPEPTLKDVGITRKQSHNWQMMAELPEKEFEQHITETKKRDEALKYPHRRSASLDHIVPISQGGHHTRKNVQLAHLGCNIQKRASRGHQLRLIG